MIKIIKLLLAIFVGIILVSIAFNGILNIQKNNPNLILKRIKSQIDDTINSQFSDNSNWLWSEGRAFVFDIIYMNIVSPGTVNFVLNDGGIFKGESTFKLKATVKQSELFKKIYKAGIVISSIVKKSNGAPLEYNELITTPEEEKTKKISFFPSKNVAEREGIKFKIPDNTYDPLSVFFNFLSSDFKIGEEIVLSLLSKEEIYDFKITPIEMENDIYKLVGEVYRQDRSSTHGAKFTIWVLGGEVRVPLLVKVVSAAGPVYLRLKSVK
ncbi:DUF3108 domain-containing protein [Candidatus Omnitrophota bacterium]